MSGCATLLDLAQRGIARFTAIVFITKERDDSWCTVELNNLDQKSCTLFVPLR